MTCFMLVKLLAIYSQVLQATRESPSEPVNLLRLFPTAVRIREHALKAGHDKNIDNFKIYHMTNKTSLTFSESSLISNFNFDLNIVS